MWDIFGNIQNAAIAEPTTRKEQDSAPAPVRRTNDTPREVPNSPHQKPPVSNGQNKRVGGNMPLGENLRVAFGGLAANKLRAMLTMLGVIIGVAAVIAMIAVGEGARQKTLAQIKALGTNLLIGEPERRRIGAVRGRAGSWNRLKIDDLEKFGPDTTPAVLNVSPEITTQIQVKAGNQNADTNLFGVWAEWFEIRGHKAAMGRLFTADEEKKKAKVVVLGHSVYQQLFPNGDDPVGRLVRVNNIGVECIGVLAPKGSSGNQNNDDVVVVPAGTAQKRLLNFWQGRPRQFSAQAVSEDKMADAQKQIDDLFRKQYRVKPGDPGTISVRSQSEIAQFANETGSTFTALLASIAGVSLFVGGIGIMNIMLVSVTERTKEIGVRKAIGAKRRDILLQFLIEAVSLSVLGGIIGILLGVGIAIALPKLNAETSTILTLPPILLSFGFSAAVGIFFGFYPALKASKLDPIVALRYE
jgi:putative ABC transport system permease protein